MSTVNYQIKLDQFEGPFDLLLFFIERDELDIYNIPITKIINDFLDFIHGSEKLNIELSSEFILFVSTLMRIKARLLLPRKEIDASGNEIDPRQELIDKILEYKKFKEAAVQMAEMEAMRMLMVKRGNLQREISSIGEEASEGTEIQNITLFKLMKAFEKVMQRVHDRQNKPVHTVVRYNYTMEGSRDYMLDFVGREKTVAFEKVFEIGPRFRNENYSDEHLPEHNAMEWYWSSADWEMGMSLTEEMIRYVCDKTWGTRQFTLTDGKQVDFGKDGEHFGRVSFIEILKDQYNIDVFESTMPEIQAALKAEKLEVEKSDNRIRSLDKLWKKYRKTIAGPVFLIDIPVFMQPLAKTNLNDTRLTEQFNLVFGGSEMCKAFSELNDPIDQLERFMEQQKLREAGDDEAQMLDIDFVEALEYGMPPACGLGYSERIFWSLEGVSAREGIPFPQLKSEIDETTRDIYKDINFN
ncbi:MAG: hypothetical protein B7Z27_00945 [Sphingobacteriia bacterium 32-37-4]|nr:MAG: hypothetical protein B7Z27_00945 [Sphingobacteriia bacterium 32-37-4]